MKESLRHVSRDCVFRETFNSFSDIKKNGGTITSAPSLSNGIISFDGVDDKITYSNDIKYSFQSPKTLHLKCKFNSVTATKIIISKDDMPNTSVARERALGFFVTGKLRFYLKGELTGATQISRETDAIFTTGVWYDIVVTYDGGTTNSSIKIYSNGVQVDTTDTGTGVFTKSVAGPSPMYVGTRGVVPTEFLNQQIEYINIYNRTLSASEVSALSNNSLYKRPSMKNAVIEIIDKSGVIQNKYSAVVSLQGGISVKKDNGYAMFLDGNGDYLAFTSQSLTGDFTYSLWFKTAVSGKNFMGLSSANTDYMFMNATNTVNGTRGGVSRTFNTPTLTDNKRHNMIFSRISNNLNVYIDGVVSTTGALVNANTLTVDQFHRYSNTTANDWTGYASGHILINGAGRTAEECARYRNSTKNLYL